MAARRALWLFACVVGSLALVACAGEPTATVELPEGFPTEVPVYPGARATNAFASENADGTTAFFASWQSGDTPDSVIRFYENAFGDRFVVGERFSFLGVEQFVLEDAEGNLGRGVLTISPVTGEEAGTRIGLSIGLPEAAAEVPTEVPTAGPPPAEVDLPADYPSEKIPIVPGGLVVGAEAVPLDSGAIFAVTVVSEQRPEEVQAFYRQQLKDAGMSTVEEGDGGTWAASFEGTAIRGGIALGSDFRYPGYTVIDIYIEPGTLGTR